MARPLKSEDGRPTKSTGFKITDRHRFALHLLARMGDVEMVSVIEQAVEQLADTKLADLGVHWSVIYDPELGVRMLNAFSLPRYRPSTKEEELIAMLRAYPRFWWSDDEQKHPRRDFVAVLWANREKYLKLWRQRDKDYWAPAEAMAHDLKKARPDVKLPKWGDK